MLKQRSKAQRVLNEALALVETEEYASMYLPVQPVRGWDEKREEAWRKYLRDDVRPCLLLPIPNERR